MLKHFECNHRVAPPRGGGRGAVVVTAHISIYVLEVGEINAP